MDSLIARARRSCRLSRPDNRDWIYSADPAPQRPVVDLREWDSRVEDQKTLGSCVGHAIAGAYELILNRNYPNLYTELSALYVYYNARIEESMTDIDSGATIRDGIRGVKHYGICSEELWPYDVTKFNERPSLAAYADGRRRTLENYRRLWDTQAIVRAVNNNRPVVIGMSVYNGFFDLNPDNSTVELPEDKIKDYFGEHAVYIVGYDQEKEMFLCKNSFGTEWGDRGYFWMPYDYAKTEVFEAWVFDIVVK